MAKPFLKRAVWYGRIRDRRGVWVTCKLLPQPDNKRHAEKINRDLQAIEDDYRTGRREVPKHNTDTTFGALIDWYLAKRLKGTPSYDAKGPTLRRHLIDWKVPADRPELADLPLGPRPPAEITADRLTAFFKYKVEAGELAPATANGIRATVRAAFNAASAAERFHGDNPITAEGVKPHLEPTRKPLYLEPEWIAKILDNVLERYRGIFATGIYLGLRKGEIFALQKCDVDLNHGLLYVRRSHDRTIPKSGFEEGLPIPAELLPYLRRAIASSPTELVFPDPRTGLLYHRRYNLVKVLRSCLKRIGFGVTGYLMKCRRTGKQSQGGVKCGYVSDLTKDGRIGPCPRCGYKLWPAAQVERFRFHDTRHTTGSLLTMFGANPKAVQKLMRHRHLASTEIYAHLAPGYLRQEADLMTFRTAAPAEAESQADALVATAGPGFATPLLPEGETGDLEALSRNRKPPVRTVGYSGAGEGARTLDVHLGKVDGTCSNGPSASQPPVNTSSGNTAGRSRSQPDATNGQGFATRLLPGAERHIQALDGGRAPRLLTTREVARYLAVAPATVYRLCATGALSHVRVLGAIRVSRADLDAFIAAQKRGAR